MTDAELNRILEARYGAGKGPYYVGFISSVGFTAIDEANDTMASHPGWQEFTGYATPRPEWTPGAAAAQAISNPGRAIIAATAGGTVVGVFLTDSPTRGGTTGNMVRPKLLSTPLTFVSGKNLRVLINIPARRVS